MSRASARLGAAAAVSIAAHAALIAGSWLTPPEAPPDLPQLTARLESLPPPPVTAQPPAPKPRAVTPQPRRIAAVPRPAPAAPVEVEPSQIPVIEAAASEPAAAPAVEPVVVASAEPTAFRMPEAPPLPEFPRRGRIAFQLTMGPDQTPVGRTVQTWEFGDAQYKIGSQSESSGLIELFRPHRFHYLSQGLLTEQGLRPERFLSSIKRGSRTEETLAVFDWNAGRVRLGRLPQQDTVDLPPGSQDWISFIYNLALSPLPQGRITLPFTRGSRLEMTSFDVLPQETIETPLGQLRTVPVVQVRENDRESLAVWLATDYRNLPVRIRFFGRDGEAAGEQLVSEIQVSER
ncbi:MAG: DUF3108 domain-containing protein [Burkholderiales bacterium]